MESINDLTKNIENATNKFKDTSSTISQNADFLLKNPSKIIDKLKNNTLFKNKYNILFLILVLGLLIYTAYFVFNKYVKNRLTPKYVSNNEFIDKKDDDDDETVLKLYHASEWCPHSKDVLDPKTGNWVLFKNKFNNKVVNGKKLVFEEINCSNIGENNYDGTLDKETKDIDGYPTIKLLANGESIIYNNDVASSNTLALNQLEEFIKNNI